MRQILRFIPTSDKFLKLVHARVSWVFIALALYLLTLGPFLNIIGLKGLNLIPLFIWVIAWIVIALHPEVLAALITVRLPGSPSKKKMETIKETLADALPKIFGEIGIWPTTILFFLSTISAGNNPKAIWTIYGAALILAIYTIRYLKDARFFKKLAYGYAVAVIVLSLISLIPSHYQIKYFGADITYVFTATSTEKAVAETDEIVRNAKEKEIEKKLEGIAKRAKAGKLTEEDKKFFREMKKQAGDNSLVRKISYGVGSLAENVSEGIRTLRSKPAQVAEKKLEAPILAPAPQVQALAPALQLEPPAAEVPGIADPSGKYKFCWTALGRYGCIEPVIVEVHGDTLSIDHDYWDDDGNTYNIKFSGTRTGKIFSGDWVLTEDRSGKISSGGFEIDLETPKGKLYATGGPYSLKIRKIS